MSIKIVYKIKARINFVTFYKDGFCMLKIKDADNEEYTAKGNITPDALKDFNQSDRIGATKAGDFYTRVPLNKKPWIVFQGKKLPPHPTYGKQMQFDTARLAIEIENYDPHDIFSMPYNLLLRLLRETIFGIGPRKAMAIVGGSDVIAISSCLWKVDRFLRSKDWGNKNFDVVQPNPKWEPPSRSMAIRREMQGGSYGDYVRTTKTININPPLKFGKILEKYPETQELLEEFKEQHDYLKERTNPDIYRLFFSFFMHSHQIESLKYLATKDILGWTAEKIVSSFSAKEIEDLKNNPYILLKIKGMGFIKVDTLALNSFKVDKLHEWRILAAANVVLMDKVKQGNTCISKSNFDKALVIMLGYAPKDSKNPNTNIPTLREKLDHWIKPIGLLERYNELLNIEEYVYIDGTNLLEPLISFHSRVRVNQNVYMCSTESFIRSLKLFDYLRR